MNISDYPEYQAAVKREREIRELSFLDYPRTLCGISVPQLTIRRFIWLLNAETPFIVGGEITPGHCAQFLWMVSAEFTYPKSTSQRALFIKKIRTLEFSTVIEEIEAFLEDALLDEPPTSSGGEGKASYVSFVASWIDDIASEYGWTDEHILELKIARLFQYLKRIRNRDYRKAGKRPVEFNKFSDRVKKSILLNANQSK